MTVSEYEIRSAVLRWHKRAAGQWLLKAEDGTIWVAITAWKCDGRLVQHMWRATFMPITSFCSGGAGNPGHWTIGRQVAALKARAVHDLARYSHAYFQIQG